MKQVFLAREARKDLKRHGRDAQRVFDALLEYAVDQNAHANNVTKMVGSTGKRIRVGNFRATFEEQADKITVTAIGPRGSIYGAD